MPLFLEGFPAHSVFAIRRGRCKALQSSADGREAVLRAYGPGDFVGLDSLTAERYTHSVHATTRATVCHAPRTLFSETVVSSPDFARVVIDHLSEELRDMRSMMASLDTAPVRGRVAVEVSVESIVHHVQHVQVELGRDALRVVAGRLESGPVFDEIDSERRAGRPLSSRCHHPAMVCATGSGLLPTGSAPPRRASGHPSPGGPGSPPR